ncbi:MAG: hypothetical protein JRG93_12415 [Deltaproteobacteria bacterium]|nr:hypothetical protein [Deltaproteobacteria bacterium]
MKHFTALRREEAARQTFRPLLADELRFGAAVQCSNDDFDQLASGPGISSRSRMVRYPG